MNDATHLYITGNYGIQHSDWHLSDAPNKVKDIITALQLIIENSNKSSLKIADIGCGVGGVLNETVKLLNQNYPHLELTAIGFEIASSAVEVSRQLFPTLDIRQKAFERCDGCFDLVMFIDVLEHLENPWEMLRIARDTSEYIAVRQPLLENFSTFRYNNYRNEREHWGHIGYFNYHSFMDMTQATGWKPIKLDLCPCWELAGDNKGRASLLHKFLVKTNRIMASYVLSGFYLNGVFQRY
ncbi:MAG: methyltransferase domain-containing protein [Nostoc sp.]|uniref:class I SAM-dependent methyltransferase n=1 Tax=Nostoc sp. TaxID=1180 RepID=UPI002FEF3CE0